MYEAHSKLYKRHLKERGKSLSYKTQTKLSAGQETLEPDNSLAWVSNNSDVKKKKSDLNSQFLQNHKTRPVLENWVVNFAIMFEKSKMFADNFT